MRTDTHVHETHAFDRSLRDGNPIVGLCKWCGCGADSPRAKERCQLSLRPDIAYRRLMHGDGEGDTT